MSNADIVTKYLAPQIEIAEPAILVTVNRLFRRNMADDEIYEIYFRGNWVVDERKNKAKYAFCVYNGTVRQVCRDSKVVSHQTPKSRCGNTGPMAI